MTSHPTCQVRRYGEKDKNFKADMKLVLEILGENRLLQSLSAVGKLSYILLARPASRDSREMEQ